MNEYLFEANEELKRADHLVFVSLKYTRTVDVIKNIINRLISVYELSINALLANLQEKKRIEKIPETPLAKAELVKKAFANDQKIQENINFIFCSGRYQKRHTKAVRNTEGMSQ